MEEQPSSGDMLLLSKLNGPAAALIQNAAGGICLFISMENSKLIGTNGTIKMYKVLFNGKISHVTKDRITKIVYRS
jgi:hypothetical protein